MPQETMNQLMQWLPMVIIFVLLIVVMIVPQKRREKKIRTMLDSMKVGDNVKTIGGICGKIVQLKEDLVTIETGPDKAKIVFAKGAIGSVESADVENEQL